MIRISVCTPRILPHVFQREPHSNRCPLAGAGFNDKFSTQEASALRDAYQPEPAFLLFMGISLFRIEASAVILNCYIHTVIAPLNYDFGFAGTRVLDDVVNGLLDDAVEVDLFFFGKETIE